MSAKPPKPRPTRPRIRDSRRVSRYVDSRIQGGLIASILIFELLLIVIGMFLIQHDLHQVIEDQLFRIHPSAQEEIPILLYHLMGGLGVIVLANIALVIVIEWFWSCYIEQIVAPLRGLFDAVCLLDLRNRPEPAVAHEVLDRAGDWVQTERLRCVQLLQLTEELSPDMETHEAKKIIQEIRQCLPENPID